MDIFSVLLYHIFLKFSTIWPFCNLFFNLRAVFAEKYYFFKKKLVFFLNYIIFFIFLQKILKKMAKN